MNTPPGRLNTPPAIAQGRGDWRDNAKCRDPQENPDTWYDPDNERDAELAAILCMGCPVLRACRAWVMATEPETARHGVTAGLTPVQRSMLHRGRRINDRVMRFEDGENEGEKAC